MSEIASIDMERDLDLKNRRVDVLGKGGKWRSDLLRVVAADCVDVAGRRLHVWVERAGVVQGFGVYGQAAICWAANSLPRRISS
ncbi:hypothetical protein [Amycolatopsis sp. DSM 110486]|uniref:hypothetical protein n=1 Tax=Amycolatopsis sp. DSM 110486 TaxID=2865832 RepID=UPI001C6A2703|nr:hypothetical protein [Amycolatopsis sp. DSM 110486]QYN21726.1 hypothetical protein K1T34_04090 [Amycolatopsis sp. DSM 110486]